MKRFFSPRRSVARSVRLLVAVTVFLVTAWPAILFAPPPAWWTTRGAVNTSPADDYAAANLGQLKHFASKAALELGRLPGGAGSDITALIGPWSQPPLPGVTRDDHAAVNLGQLKAVAAPFYTRLRLANLNYPNPWTSISSDDDDYAVANLGQLKHVFSFDLNRDDDGDGLDDLQEVLTGGNPASPDTDDDGISDGEEGTVDTDGDGIPDYRDPDSDDDGVGDGSGGDHYPKDARRSEDVPVKYYGVIDLSQAEFEGQPIDVSNVTTVGIDDSNGVSFANVESMSEWESNTTTYTWRDGEIVGRRYLPADPIDDELTRSIIAVVGITGAGAAVGIASTPGVGAIETDWDVDSVPVFIDPPEGSSQWEGVSRFTNPLPRRPGSGPYTNPGDPLFSSSGIVGGATELWHPDEGENGVSHFQLFKKNPSQRGNYLDGYRNNYWPTRISPNGTIFAFTTHGGPGIIWGDTVLEVPELVSWPTVRKWPFALNDQRQVIGSQRYQVSGEDEEGYEDPAQTFPDGTNPNGTPRTRMGRGELGYLWTPETGIQTFHDLLPEKLRKQLRSAVPYLITNVDPVTNQPTITFSAESWEGPAGEEAWVTRAFTWSRGADGEPWVETIHIPEEEGMMLPRAVNVHGTLVYDPDVPKLAFPMEFEAANINLGFDPPIAGDQVPRGPLDHAKPEWWTVVAGEGTAEKINTNVKVIFSNGKTKPSKLKAEVIVPQGGSAAVTVQPQGELAQGQLLTIAGNTLTSRTRKMAEVGLTPLGTTQTTRRPLKEPRLYVDVLPLRQVKVAIYYLHDVAHGVGQIPGDYQSATAIKNKLNQVFEKQACVHFEIARAEPLNVPFDLDGDKALWMDYISTEYLTVRPQALPLQPKELKLFLVQRFATDGSPLIGVTKVELENNKSIGSDRCFIESFPFTNQVGTNPARGYADFLTTIAHEVGHAMGLSTRQEPNIFAGQNFKNHDAKFFPMRDYYLEGARVPLEKRQMKPELDSPMRLLHGLMSQGTPPGEWRWIRHEDWVKANDIAGRNFDP